MDVLVPQSTWQGLLLQSPCIPAIHGGQMCESGLARESRDRFEICPEIRRFSICRERANGEADALRERSRSFRGNR